MDTCQKIAKFLKHVINIRIIIARTYAYTLTEHCLRLARGVTEQRNVYVQSRCKRDTHDTLG